MFEIQIKYILFILTTLWLKQTHSFEVKCVDTENGWSFNPKSQVFEKCLSCYIYHLYTMQFEIFVLAESKDWDANTINISFHGGTLLFLPLLLTKSNFKQVLSIDIIETNTEFLNNSFFKDLSINLKRFTSYGNNGLTLSADCFMECFNLEVLNLSYNNISQIPSSTFQSLHKLLKLDLRFNSLTSVKSEWFKNLHFLETLQLSYNEIKMLSNGVFNGLTNLKFIQLLGNQIQSISRKTFECNSHLEEVELSWNNIRGIQVGSFEGFKNLTVLGLKRNKCIDTTFSQINRSNLVLDLAQCYCKIPEITGGYIVDTTDNSRKAAGSYYVKELELKVVCEPSFSIVLNKDHVNFNSCPEGLWVMAWATCESEKNI